MKNTLTLLSVLTFTAFAPQVLAAEAIGAKNNGPIEINADTLEVLQQQNKAIFSGNVVAVQGDMRLKSDKMTVHYTRAEGKEGGPKTEGGSGIERIEVQGNVFLSTPEETASGTSGLYNVTQREVDLIDNVVVTRGKNVLKGDRLTYNLATGKSVVSSKGAATDTTGKKQRVRALFVPGSEDGKAN